jgi:thiol-disulfide isomerase/thioredoxin
MAALFAAVAEGHAQVKVGDAFPALPAAAASVAAGKVVLVDFWASWCAPCKASFPAYNRILHDYQAGGLVVVGIGVDEDPAAYESFVKRNNPAFVVARDADHFLVGRVRIPTMPTSYLIDRSGRVRFLHAGYRGAETDAALRREIETLLAEKAS